MAHGDITHIEIPADDIARASGFYSALLGWSINEVPGYEGYPMWQAPNGVSGGAITPRDSTLTQPRSYIEVDSIQDTLAKVGELGGTVVLGKSPISDTSWWAVIMDTEGNQMGLFEGVTSTEGSG